MRIAGFHSGHDSSYCILENGIPIIHVELERHTRRKNIAEDSIEAFFKHEDVSLISHGATHRGSGMVLNRYMDSFNKFDSIMYSYGGKFYITGHHQGHAANAFFTSNYNESLILTIDGGGIDYTDGSLHDKRNIDREDSKSFRTCTTVWYGKDNKIHPIDFISSSKINIGFYWSNVTSKIFGLGIVSATKYDPRGDQAGTVMGMAALGDPKKYLEYFKNIHDLTTHRNWGPTDYDYLKNEAEKSEQNKFDIAASLQYETEILLKNIITKYINQYPTIKNLCLSGGSSLNCVAAGKTSQWFPEINVFCDPVPYDSGISIGSCRYVWHQLLDNPRIYNNSKNQTPYLGCYYGKNDIHDAIEHNKHDIKIHAVDDFFVINELMNKKIISVYGGNSESGRRALGNRSILADPRHPEIKDIVNEKVKHRQWFRPFAPSVLREDIKDWFEYDIDSPYMSFALPFKQDKKSLVPAVVHFDGTARVQTVSESGNPWYYSFIKLFKEKTSVPMLLNTSFNDREPIVETPSDAINCFMKTNIDYLYFRDHGILISKS